MLTCSVESNIEGTLNSWWATCLCRKRGICGSSWAALVNNSTCRRRLSARIHSAYHQMTSCKPCTCYPQNRPHLRHRRFAIFSLYWQPLHWLYIWILEVSLSALDSDLYLHSFWVPSTSTIACVAPAHYLLDVTPCVVVAAPVSHQMNWRHLTTRLSLMTMQIYFADSLLGNAYPNQIRPFATAQCQTALANTVAACSWDARSGFYYDCAEASPA